MKNPKMETLVINRNFDDTKPSVCMVAYHCCIRVFKEAYPLNQKGYRLGLLTNQLGSGWNMFEPCMAYLTPDQFRWSLEYLEKYGKFQIYHVHNEPDWIARIVCEVVRKNGKKVIWDIHDIESARIQSIPFEEQEILKKVDGIVHVSDSAKKWTNQKHSNLTPNQIILGSLLPEALIRNKKTMPYRIKNSIVYEGGLSPAQKPRPVADARSNSDGQSLHNYDMRDYSRVIFALSNEGFKPYILQSDNEIGAIGATAQGYIQYGAVPEPAVAPTDLPTVLSKYEWGLVGVPFSFPLGDMALPNKLFEYLSAGVVPIVINCKQAGEFVEKNNIGLYIKSDKDFFSEGYLRKILHPDNICNNEYYREQIEAFQPSLIMENQIHLLENLYRTVLTPV